MRLTIIKPDNCVGIDGEFYTVDCSGLPDNFHALQWDGDVSVGEIEWSGRPKPQNTVIEELCQYSAYIDAWSAAKQAAETLQG